jgi:hypothetical protein
LSHPKTWPRLTQQLQRLLTHETEEGKEAAGEEEPDHDVGQAVHAQIETTAAHQSAPRAENRPSEFEFVFFQLERQLRQLKYTRAHHVLKIKMVAISICLEM